MLQPAHAGAAAGTGSSFALWALRSLWLAAQGPLDLPEAEAPGHHEDECESAPPSCSAAVEACFTEVAERSDRLGIFLAGVVSSPLILAAHRAVRCARRLQVAADTLDRRRDRRIVVSSGALST